MRRVDEGAGGDARSGGVVGAAGDGELESGAPQVVAPQVDDLRADATGAGALESGALQVASPQVDAAGAGSTWRAGARKAGRIVLQLGLVACVCLAGERLAAVLPIDVPGNICSMVLLLVFLLSGVVRAESISDAADFLLDHMALFFVPAAVAIMGSYGLLAGNVLKLLVICLVTTVLVFCVTSATVSAVARLMDCRDVGPRARDVGPHGRRGADRSAGPRARHDAALPFDTPSNQEEGR